MTSRAGLTVDPKLAAFIETEALQGLDVSPERFWTGLAALVGELGPKNRALLARRDALQAKLDFTLLPAGEEQVPSDVFRDHAGVHPQRQPGLSYVGATVLRGRLTGEQLEAAAELSERFGSGALRATVSQNLLFINVPNAKVGELVRELGQIGLCVEATNFWRGTVACTGTEFCKLAITETKGFARWLVGESCSIADIGCWGRMVFMAEGGMSLDKRPHAAAWRDRLMAMSGFALPYDLIPKKDAELNG